MPRKIEVGDEVVVRGEVVKVEDDGFVRVRFPGYQYPITIQPNAVEQVVKPPKPRFKRLRDIPD